MKFPFSVYQIALFSFIENEEGSCIVDAKAGSGKTTSILAACDRLPKGSRILFLAFNRSIVAELKEKLPSGVVCKTFNGCGWNAWVRYTGKSYNQIKIDAKKTWRIIWDCFQKEDQLLYGSFVNKMVALAKSSGLTPDSSDSDWYEIMDHHDVTMTTDNADYDRGISLSKRTLQKSISIASTVCDFDDQIYMPWLSNASFDKYDAVFIDEAQDTNSVQCQLLKRMLTPKGRLIAVGDPNQAIYGFRGADSNAMNNIQREFNAKTLPLSISYRCAKSVVALAREYVPNIESSDTAPEGEINHLEKYDVSNFSSSDAVLCRNNAPLVEIAYQFIARGRGVNFLGRDLGAGLCVLVRNMEAKDLDDLSIKLGVWLDKETSKLLEKKQEEKVEILEDKVRCIDIFIANLPQSRQSVPQLLAAIEDLFKANDRGITLSSIHKSKGREWDRVFVLEFGLMPSKYARKDWMKVQENNLIYVAITRAKETLNFINSNGWTDESGMVIPETRKIVEVPIAKSTAKQPKLGGYNPFANS